MPYIHAIRHVCRYRVRGFLRCLQGFDSDGFVQNLMGGISTLVELKDLEAKQIGELFKTDEIAYLPDYRKQEIMDNLLKARLGRQRIEVVQGDPVPKDPEIAF